MKVKRVLSIEIGFSTTKVCEIDFNKKNPKIYRCVIFDTPENTIEDGYIRDKKGFAQTFKEELQKAKIKLKDVVFTIASNKILSREVTIPAVKDKLIGSVVKAEVNDYFPMDISDHTVTYTLMERLTAEKQLRLMVYAAPENLIQNYYNLAEEMNLHIIALDYTGNAAYQWLKRASLDEISFVLQIGEQSSLVTVMEKGNMALQRTINYGLSTMLEAVLDCGVYQVKDTKEALLLLQKASILKERMNFNLLEEFHEVSFDEEYVRMMNGKNEVTESIRGMVNNVARIMEYYGSKNKVTISKIYMTGQGNSIVGIKELLANELGVSVKELKPTEGVSFKSKYSAYEKRSNELLCCLGAAYAPINFVSAALLSAEQKKSSGTMRVLLTVLSISAAFAMIYVPYMLYQTEKEKQTDLLEQLDALTYINHIYDQYAKTAEAENAVREFHDSTFSYHEYLNELITQLEEKLPTEAVIHSFTSNEQGFNMNITVLSKEAAAKVLLQLQLVPYIRNVQIGGITEIENEETGTREVSFSVACTYTRPEGEVEE